MRTLELYCGTKSFSKVAEVLGHSTFTVDNDARFNADLTADVRLLDPSDLPGGVEVLWASPPCQGFSVAAIGRNWHRDRTPKTDSARLSVELVERTLDLIAAIKPTWFFIENPRAMLRKLPYLKHLRRVTVTYCQYGDTRMKPTDIWTNVPASLWEPRPICKNGASCHMAAPRGSKTGTQGLKSKVERGEIPADLFREIFEALEPKPAILFTPKSFTEKTN